VVPNVYKYKGVETEFAKVNQAFTIDDAGTMTVTKGDQKATAKAGGQIEGDIEKYATVPDAINMLRQMGTGCITTAMNYINNPKADPQSVKNIIEGLKKSTINLAVVLNCNNKYSWSDPDRAEFVRVSGFAGAKPAKATDGDMFHTGQSRKFIVPIGQVFNLDKLSPNQPLSIEASIKGWTTHSLTFNIGYPYEAHKQPLSGTDRYTINTSIQIGN